VLLVWLLSSSRVKSVEPIALLIAGAANSPFPATFSQNRLLEPEEMINDLQPTFRFLKFAIAITTIVLLCVATYNQSDFYTHQHILFIEVEVKEKL